MGCFHSRSAANEAGKPSTSADPSSPKPREVMTRDSFPDATHEAVAKALSSLVADSAENPNVAHNIHAPMYSVGQLSWIHKLIPGIERIAVEYHCGNYVLVRGSTEQFFESMPLYARIGMHLLFYGKEQIKLLGNKRVEEILREESVKQGVIYDDLKSVHAIPPFVETYAIKTDELLEPDINKYGCFNEFFFRKLKPGARPVQDADQKGICSAADCRLTVYTSVDLAKSFWIKGQGFNIPKLLNIPIDSERLKPFQDASLAIFRLAPADYHRFHSPVDCEVGDIEHVEGNYYTVNPEAVNEPGFDVFTANTRSILYLKHKQTGQLIAFVAIGALLVGSIRWTGGEKKGTILNRGDELGYFAYGGSTVVVLFPKGVVEFDEDLVANSQKPIETLVKVCLISILASGDGAGIGEVTHWLMQVGDSVGKVRESWGSWFS